MTLTYTPEARARLEAYLATHDLPSGMGDAESACTVAAIRLAIDGKLSDDPIDCMSEVLRRAAIGLQDAMPDDMRNSARYKSLIPDMPGTGRDLERERLDVLLDWMWGVVLPELQSMADAGGYGDAWRKMCEDRSSKAAYAAAYAAYAAADAAAHAAEFAARAIADAAAYAADADFWTRVDPIGVLERMTYLGEKE